MLRQPLEDGLVVISRAQGSVSVTFPAKFMLVGAMNPCPCGYHGDPTRECGCSPGAVARYQKRLSGPLLDRIDVHVEVPRVAHDKLAGATLGEASAAIRARVQVARARQAARLAGSGLLCNAEMGPKGVRASCVVAEEAQGLLKAAMARLQLSARAHHRVLKLARTLADLAASERISAPHLVEAVQYRPRSHTPSAMTASALSPCYHPAHCHERQAAGDADARAARPRRAPLAPYHALPEYLTRFGKRTVSIPYAPILAALVPVDHGRVRRDFPCLLSFKWAPQARTGLDSPDTGAYTNVTLSVTASRYLRQETRYEVRGCSSLLDLGTADGDRVPGPPGPRQHRSQGGDMRA